MSSSDKKITTVLCGIGGYGETYLESYFDKPDSPFAFVGFVDPAPERSAFFDRIRALGTPIYRSLEEFYKASGAELAILAVPIQFHCPLTILALEHGSHVLCEKPLCATVQEAHAMLDAQRRAGRIVAIGYQGSYLESTQRLKADIRAGVWGRPVAFKCMVHWPRGPIYYQRNRWAGRIKDDQGRWVLDSPANNANAHFLHHMLYLLGDAPNRSAVPEEVEAQLYRARDIENYDTAFMQFRVAGGTDVFFATSHAVSRLYGPVFELTFEKGRVEYLIPDGEIVGTHRDGTKRSYGRGSHGGNGRIVDTVAAIREGRESLCGIEAAMSQTIVMNGAQESGSPIVDIPRALVREVELDGKRWVEATGMEALIASAYSSARLPDPAQAAWIKPGRKIKLSDYRSFPKEAMVGAGAR